jgi:hypothetical protein
MYKGCFTFVKIIEALNITMQQRSILLFLVFFSISFLYAQDAPKIPNNEEEYNIQYERNIRKTRINRVYIPRDIKDAFNELKRLSPPEATAKFKKADEEIIKSRLHFGLGRWIIENWNFYGGSRISHLLKGMGISFPDDMAQFLIVSYHRHLNDRPLELEDRAKSYHDLRLKEQLKRESEGTLIKEETRKKNGGN